MDGTPLPFRPLRNGRKSAYACAVEATPSMNETDYRLHEPRWRLSTRELVLILLFWTCVGLISVINRMIDPRTEGMRFLPAISVALPMIEAWTWAVLTPLIFGLSSWMANRNLPWIAWIPLLILAGIGVALLVDFFLFWVRIELLPFPRRRGPGFAPLRGIGRFRILHQFVIYCAVLAAGLAREFFLRDRERQHQAVALNARTAHLEAQLANARLDALRMQINPHFLFNTLHAISALVQRDPAGVRRMIARLSELLRHTLERKGSDEVTLREEMAVLERYFEIMEVRFQGRITIHTSVPEEAQDALVPNFILQPLVENALEHGAGRAEEAGEVVIEARIAGSNLILTIRDNGPGAPGDPGQPGGVGLANTRARLEALYGSEADLTLSSAPGHGVLATIRLPYRRDPRRG